MTTQSDQYAALRIRCSRYKQLADQKGAGSDDQTVGVWRLKGTQTKPLFGIPATNRTLEFTVASVFTFRDDRLVDYFVIAGALEAATQMGVKLELPTTETASP